MNGKLGKKAERAASIPEEVLMYDQIIHFCLTLVGHLPAKPASLLPGKQAGTSCTFYCLRGEGGGGQYVISPVLIYDASPSN